jgi:hypothetical protein
MYEVCITYGRNEKWHAEFPLEDPGVVVKIIIKRILISEK